jgi:hypothetical protein
VANFPKVACLQKGSRDQCSAEVLFSPELILRPVDVLSEYKFSYAFLNNFPDSVLIIENSCGLSEAFLSNQSMTKSASPTSEKKIAPGDEGRHVV